MAFAWRETGNEQSVLRYSWSSSWSDFAQLRFQLSLHEVLAGGWWFA